jgi:hypothetical protein
MQNKIPDELVRIAALRVNALRRLIALTPPGVRADDSLRAQLTEAENLLRYRLHKFARQPERRDAPARQEQA